MSFFTGPRQVLMRAQLISDFGGSRREMKSHIEARRYNEPRQISQIFALRRYQG